MGVLVTGTLINVGTVMLGTVLGLLLGNRLGEQVRETVLRGLGLITVVIGIQMSLETQNILIVMGAILFGGILGEWLRIEAGLDALGRWLETRFNRGSDADGAARFVRGFVVTSLLFCVGPMTILGSIQDGLSGDYRLLAIKSMLDGFAALAFASSLGIGVGFSALTVLLVQGSISLFAAQVQGLLSEEMITEMTAAGGVMIVGLGLSSLLEIVRIRVGNLLPALLIAPLIVALLLWIGMPVAPQF